MKYYASTGRIGTDPLENGIEISDAEYQFAIQAMLAGKLVSVENGNLEFLDPPSEEMPAEESIALTADDVKQEARRRLSLTDWKTIKHRDQLDAGGPTSLSPEEYASLLAERAGIRAASNAIQMADPIPADFTSDIYWIA